MSELISGKEAWIAKADKEDVQYRIIGMNWDDLTDKEFINWETHRFLSENSTYEFRLKPKTITLNGIEVPAPFKPKDGDKYYYIDSNREICYDWDNNDCGTTDENRVAFGAWRTEEEIKQVVAALRSIFNAN